MKWLKRLLVFAVALLLLLLCALPPLVGWFSRDWLQTEIARLQGEGVDIDLVALTGGWRHSQARLSAAGAAGQSAELQLAWQHGPLLSRPDWGLGWLQLHSEGALRPDKEGIVSLSSDARLGLGLRLEAEAQLSPGQPASPMLEGGSLMLDATATLTAGNINLNLTGEQLRAPALGLSELAQGTLSLDWRASPQQAGDGSLELTLDQLTLSSDDRQAEVDALELSSTWQTSAAGLTEWQLENRTLGLQWREHSYPSATLAVQGRDFDVPATLGALKLFLQLQGNANAGSAQQLWWAVLISEIPQVVASRPSVALESLQAVTPWGPIEAEARFDLDDASERQLQQPMLLDEAMSLRGEVELPRVVLESAITAWQNQSNPSAPRWPASYSERLLQQWLREGLWQSRGERQVYTRFDYARGGLLLNDVPLLNQP